MPTNVRVHMCAPSARCAVPCCAVPCCAGLCCAACATLCCTALCCAVVCRAGPYCAVHSVCCVKVVPLTSRCCCPLAQPRPAVPHGTPACPALPLPLPPSLAAPSQCALWVGIPYTESASQLKMSFACAPCKLDNMCRACARVCHRSHYVRMTLQTVPVKCECGSRDTCNALPTGDT